jgi:hypothetical protein
MIADSLCSPATIRKAKQLLEGVVQNGTATNLKHSNIRLREKQELHGSQTIIQVPKMAE